MILSELGTLFYISTPTTTLKFIPYYYYNSKFKSNYLFEFQSREKKKCKKEGKVFLLIKRKLVMTRNSLKVGKG